MPDSPRTFDFVAPSRIVFGWGRRRDVGALASSLGRRAFVVCGSRTLELNGVLKELLRALCEAGVEPVCLSVVSREPLIEDIDTTVATLRNASAGRDDLLVAIGGGSCIDVAKAAAALVVQAQFVTVKDYLEGVGKNLKIVQMPLPVVAMPTTAGTGAEATKNAVISSLDPPFKKSLRSELLVPRIALIDPEFTVSLPPHITAWTGMDAITQLVESYMSRRATEATRGLAIAGLRYAMPAIRTAVRHGGDRAARESMSQAALLSGLALANSGLGLAHGVAAALGVHCQVAHGLACAVMLPAALRVNAEFLGDNPSPLSIAMQGDDVKWSATTLLQRADMSIAAEIDALLDDLRIPRRLSQIGVKAEQIPAIVRDSRGNSMSGNPRDVSDEELTRILEEML